jgi:hypothetical protein
MKIHTKAQETLKNNYYNKSLVKQGIAPYADYASYIDDALNFDHQFIVVELGTQSGRKLPRTEVFAPKLDATTTTVACRDIYDPNNNPDNDDWLLYMGYDTLYDKTDCVKTVSKRWCLKSNAVLLNPDFYEEGSYGEQRCCAYDRTGQYILFDDALYCVSSESFFHKDLERNYAYNSEHGYYVERDDDNVVYCVDTDEYSLYTDAYLCAANDDYYQHRENRPTNYIREYHCGPSTPFHVLPPSDNPLNNYRVGFEVEKESIDGYNSSGEYHDEELLFSHWETDSSCGVEGITNVYSLDNQELFKRHVLASNYVDEETNANCGGHINFSHRDNKMEYWHIRPWLGLIYAMWRKRLNNNYSSVNKKANPYEGRAHHYGVLCEKGSGMSRRFELRLPNRVRTGETLLNRFTLMQNLCECIDMYINEDFSYNQKDCSDIMPSWAYTGHTIYNQDILDKIPKPTINRTRFILEKCKDLLLHLYPERNGYIIYLAYLFQAYIDDTPYQDSILSEIGSYL